MQSYMQIFSFTLIWIGLLALAQLSEALVDDLCPCSPESTQTADQLSYQLAAQLSSPFLVHTASGSPLVFGKAMQGTTAAAGAPEDYGRVSAILVQPKGTLQYLQPKVQYPKYSHSICKSAAPGPANTCAHASYWTYAYQ